MFFLLFPVSGVWALLVNDTFTHVISGSRDKKVFITELRNPSNSILVCEESASVLSLCYNIDQTGVWVSLQIIKYLNDSARNTNKCYSLVDYDMEFRYKMLETPPLRP